MKSTTRTVYTLEGKQISAVEAEYSDRLLILSANGKKIYLDSDQQRELLYVLKGVEA